MKRIQHETRWTSERNQKCTTPRHQVRVKFKTYFSKKRSKIISQRLTINWEWLRDGTERIIRDSDKQKKLSGPDSPYTSWGIQSPYVIRQNHVAYNVSNIYRSLFTTRNQSSDKQYKSRDVTGSRWESDDASRREPKLSQYVKFILGYDSNNYLG